MASGAPVVQVLEVWTPATAFAVPDTLAGGSTPAERAGFWSFDDTTIEYLDFLCYLLGYGGGGLHFWLPWSAASATTGNVFWQTAVRALVPGTDTFSVSHTYSFVNSVSTAPGTLNQLQHAGPAHSDGADMDNWSNGELAVVRVRRAGDDATNDTMNGDARLWGLVGVET